MTGMALLVCCGWAVLLSLSVQAYENLALHQPAWQSSTLRSDYYGAELAVDGLYTDLSVGGGQCAVSDLYQKTAEWRVDLGGVKNIHHVFLQHATGLLKSAFLGLSVYISNTTNKEDGVLCFRDTNYTRTTIPNPVNITCPYTGRYVIYYNNRTYPLYPEEYRFTVIGLCEVEVYGCPSPKYYGKNCSLECPQNCKDGYCDIVEGTCLSCKPGFMGPRCALVCSAGLFGKDCVENCSMTCGDPGVCDKVTGHCNGRCLPGWEGDKCQNECAAASFGTNCSENCSMTCGNPGLCHKVTGNCNGSCLAGWEGDMCENECLVGFYGVNCSQNCSMTCGLPWNCDRITGYCNGGCQRGWTGVMCEEECAAASFGTNCSENCSMTCGNPGLCHKVTGNCNGSCLAGWEGDMCENECLVGFYGVNCSQNCSMTCGLPWNCDRITGYCNGGCQRGWTGVMCEEERKTHALLSSTP